MIKGIKTRKIIVLCINILLIAMEIAGLILMTDLYKSYNLHPVGWLKYYTQLSNIFSMFAALIVVIYTTKDLINNTDTTSKWVRIFKFSSACCLTETFLVTIFVLAPMGMMGGLLPLMFEGPNLFHHTLCPLVSVLSLCLLEKGSKITFRHCVYSMIPTLIYGVVSVTLNLLRVWHGPYPFLYVYEQPVYMSLIWAVIVLGGAFAITLMVKVLANIKKQKENNYGEKEQ